MVGIYKFENLVNHHCYIGQSCNVDRRINEHLWALRNNRHENTHFQRAWNKYGEDNFDITVIEECALNMLSEREIFWISHFNAYHDGYNDTLGGEGNHVLTIDIVKPICDLFNTGKFSPQEIGKMIGFDRKRVCRYLYFGNLYGLCNYDPTKSGLKKVVCLTTNMFFDSIKDAEEYYQINGVSGCCKHKHKYAGKDKNGTMLIWMYLDEYESYTDEEINNYVFEILSIYDKRIVCLNTGFVFQTKEDAYVWCGLKDHQTIIKSCNGKNRYGGKHPETGENLVWAYYKDYINMSFEEITERIKLAQIHPDDKSVICLNNMKIFDTVKQAANYYCVSREKIKNCCRGTVNSAGIDSETNSRLTWMYYDDYKNANQFDIDNKLLLSNYYRSNPDKRKRIICLNNLIVFNSQKEAGNWCKLSNGSQIGYGIRNGIEYIGKHPITNERLKWMYFDDYILCNNIDNITYYNVA